MKGTFGGQIGDDVYVCGGGSGKMNPITSCFFWGGVWYCKFTIRKTIASIKYIGGCLVIFLSFFNFKIDLRMSLQYFLDRLTTLITVDQFDNFDLINLIFST